MIEVRSERWPIPAVVVGLGLLVVGVQFAHFAGLTEFTYSVEAATEAAATDAAQSAGDEADVLYQFAELPTRAQDAFLRASESSDGRTTIRGLENQVTALGHTGDTPAIPGGGLYYVVYEGSYYEFTIRHPMSAAGIAALPGYALALSGFGYALYGSATAQRRGRALLALGCGVAGFVGAYAATDWWALNDFLPLLAVGALCAYVPSVGAWSLVGALRS